MLGVSRLRSGWMRCRRASITRMHGRTKATAEEAQQHQLPSVKIQKVSRGQHEEEINYTRKDLRKFGHRFDGWLRKDRLEEEEFQGPRPRRRGAQCVLGPRVSQCDFFDGQATTCQEEFALTEGGSGQHRLGSCMAQHGRMKRDCVWHFSAKSRRPESILALRLAFTRRHLRGTYPILYNHRIVTICTNNHNMQEHPSPDRSTSSTAPQCAHSGLRVAAFDAHSEEYYGLTDRLFRASTSRRTTNIITHAQ